MKHEGEIRSGRGDGMDRWKCLGNVYHIITLHMSCRKRDIDINELINFIYGL